MSTTLTAAKVITPVVHRENGHVEIEFEARFDGNCIGFFPNHAQAEDELNMYVLDLCERGLVDLPLALAAEQALIAACAVRCDPEPFPGEEPCPGGNDVPGPARAQIDPDEQIPPPWEGPALLVEV